MIGSMAPSAADLNRFCGTRSMNHCASAGVPGSGAAVAGTLAAGPRSAIAAVSSICTRASTGCATAMLTTVAAASRATATIALRAPARPSAPDAAIDPTLATSIETTSGITVMRIRLMKIVPTGATMATTAAAAGDEAPASARPSAKPATKPSSTRAVSDIPSFWQAVCIRRERRAA